MEKASSPSRDAESINIPPISEAKLLTIKIATNPVSGESEANKSNPISPSISITPHLYSPSPPSSAFVSALQSPYISPRAIEPPLPNETTKSTPSTEATPTPVITSVPSPASYSGGSHSDDVPTTSHTPSERYDFSGDQIDQKPKISDVGPRVSFSFPVPRVSFGRGPGAPTSSNAKLRSCDVYIGFHGQGLNLSRFCKWLKAELELEGMASFIADRAKYSDSQSHEIADRIICSAAYGFVVVTPLSFLNPFSLEEIRFFAQKKNLIPLLYDTEMSEITSLFEGKLEDKECKDAYDGFSRCHEYRLETNDTNWRSCISKVVSILRSKLGRKSIAEKEREVREASEEELPFPRNRYFVGREKELGEIETAFFGFTDVHEIESNNPSYGSSGVSDGLADEETDTVTTKDRFISLEMKKSKEPTLEAWIEAPIMELTGGNRNGVQKLRSRPKKSRISGGTKFSSSVFCVNGCSGTGKSELALEFSYRYAQRYKMVLWIGGEMRYFRQNILNLSINLGLDVSAEAEKERGRLRSFEEQELDAFQRVKRELFRDIPYLIVIDNLESERDWWEGKDLHDFIPRNTGSTHVIITTRLSKVMNFELMQLPPLSLADALVLIKGRREKDYPADESEILRKFDERLGRLSFGLWMVGSLLSELLIPPSELFEAVERVSINDSALNSGGSDDGFWRNNSYLMKVFIFCFALMDRANKGALASRMVLSGSWLAPSPVSSSLLASVANRIPSKMNPFQLWSRSITMAVCCGSNLCLTTQSRKTEAESALLLVKLGLAKRARKQPGCWIQLHRITQLFGRIRGGLEPATSAVHGLVRSGNLALASDHFWASAFLVFGFKSEPPIVQLKPVDMVLFIKKAALPLAIRSFMTFSRCSSALELLKVCTNVLEEVEKSFASQIQEMNRGSFCWRKKKKDLQQPNQKVDEYVWQEVTLLKATLLETRAKLLLRGGLFDSGEELCRTCISIRTVMLGHSHAQTLAAQETLAKIVRSRTKM
ncbi:P-loop containing nucleoside triphosphate hydrolases superfamily protein [Rhynchospora pubera]|uniref:P-loop containing nucleoside triphosphate hydrolases superfamily protein n=1 Tax=Rhynchospora pubera TaxID=906938 RepID=A0AAV8AU63_9POAL|nr:P-loop containing nucleoside triphosphate hydrolases superfamily protein [Rhynchospora pubera]KAJ4734204.1 P-loop containing nucleoside triphosphate hydrolases superfamily protein [Rhynchospora pubera]KAJ4799506.1 P-loop containing nucleoside triphosphate hydrolases superfamily protein [Rhynchospora pubera]